ncbi:MAG: exosortase-associated EpsI family protein [Verrucomicrobiota bacterium]
MTGKQRWIIVIALALMAGACGSLLWLKHHQRLGQPGIKAQAIPGTSVMQIDLPEQVLDYTSTNVPEDQIVLGYLPKDTSYAQRRYTAPDGFWVLANIILMGADRTSIHKPDYCLAGQGCGKPEKAVVNIPVDAQPPYMLPVSKWVASKQVKQQDGKMLDIRTVYVFWFVADNELTTDNTQRILWGFRDQLKTGVLQRWAYISYQAYCMPGMEDAVFDRMKKLIAASVPEFQLPQPGLIAAATAPK